MNQWYQAMMCRTDSLGLVAVVSLCLTVLNLPCAAQSGIAAPTAPTHLQRGEALEADAHHQEEAVKEFQEAIRLDPADVQAHSELADLESSMNRSSDAAEQYRAVVHLRPKEVWARVDLGGCLCALGRYDEAIREDREAIRLQELEPRQEPDVVADIYSNLGDALYRQGHYREAAGAYREDIHLYETLHAPYKFMADTYVSLGSALYKSGLKADAFQKWSAILDTPTDPQTENAKKSARTLLDAMRLLGEYQPPAGTRKKSQD